VLIEDTSLYLYDGKGWEIPSSLNLLEMSSVEEDKSVVTTKKTDNDNTQSQPPNEILLRDYL
jgi:hypothetical protein